MAAPVLWGSEISVDLGSVVGWQSSPSTIAFADGSFLMVWADDNADGDVVGQFFSADGTHKGEAFGVTNAQSGKQGMPQAALLSDGRYVVTWSTTGGDGDVGVWARTFDHLGQGGSDIYVGQTGFFGTPTLSVSPLEDGFVVTYAYVTSFGGSRATAVLTDSLGLCGVTAS
jgi:large repetitive protein